MAKKSKLQLEIRQMTLADLASVYELGEELFTADRWTNLYRTWDEYEVLTKYMSDPDTCIVAEIEGQVVGFALGTLIEKPRSAWKYGHVVWFGVREGFRNAGIAKNLMRELTELLIHEGARMMIVDTDAENLPAIKFFEKNGFGQHHAHVYMSRNLTKHPDYKTARRDE